MPKLTIGAVGDKYEQEADAVAAQVVKQLNNPAPAPVQRQERDEDELLQKKPLMPQIQRTEGYEDEEEEEIRMKPAAVQLKSMSTGGAASPELEQSIQHERGKGQPLAETVRQPMENAFGADFGGVRIHTNNTADQLNQSIQAKAFTTGQDVFFRQGAYAPESKGGQELLAHELTHVVQQSDGMVQRSLKTGDRELLNQPSQSELFIQRRIFKYKKRVGKATKAVDVSEDKFWKKIVKTAKGYDLSGLELNERFAQTIYNHFTIVNGAHCTLSEAVNYYWISMTQAYDYLLESEANMRWLAEKLDEQQAQEEYIERGSNEIMIWRGTNPNQARKILENQTMGGEPGGQNHRLPPSEDVAIRQTGFNIKATEFGKIEEWSQELGGLMGFATDGVMLVATVDQYAVAKAQSNIGERGVTGYADQILGQVMVDDIGRESGKSHEDKMWESAKHCFYRMVGAIDKTEANVPFEEM
ncbi:MAG: eCIS core domain-containing protein [Spirulinaceae cyanobacterium]